MIGTRHGGTREIIRHEQNGLLVEREDPRELAEAIKRLLGDPEMAARLASRARQDAIELYSSTRQCDLFEQLFDKLLNSGSAG